MLRRAVNVLWSPARWSVRGRQGRAYSVVASTFQAADHPEATAQTEQALKQLNAAREAAIAGGITDKSKTKHNATKLFPRERLELLLDNVDEFLEVGLLAGHGLYPEPVPAGGVVTGIGAINGQECMVIANDWTVKGGTFFPITIKKALRAQEIAAENRLPCVYLVDSGGAFLPLQAELFADRDMGGRSFYNQAIMSANSVPQVAVAMGHCTAGGAYTPAMSDEVVIVNRTGAIFLGGPPLVKAATGEIVSADDLGGADLHTRTSGVADHFAEDDAEAMSIVRGIIETLNVASRPSVAPVLPTADLDTLAGLASTTKAPAPALEVIGRLVDGSLFAEFKARFGPNLRAGFAHIEGIPVGIVASDKDGTVTAACAAKATHFVELCDRRGIPMVFLQHSNGIQDQMVSQDTLVAKHIARLMSAVSVTQVPKLTVVTGGSTGDGYWALGGRPMQPRFMFLWPQAFVASAAPEHISSTLSPILDAKEAMIECITNEKKQARAKKLMQFERRRCDAVCTSLYASARMWDDGIIAPQETRHALARALRACTQAPIARHADTAGFGVFRM